MEEALNTGISNGKGNQQGLFWQLFSPLFISHSDTFILIFSSLFVVFSPSFFLVWFCEYVCVSVSWCLCVHICRAGSDDNDQGLRKVRRIGSIHSDLWSCDNILNYIFITFSASPFPVFSSIFSGPIWFLFVIVVKGKYHWYDGISFLSLPSNNSSK